jgi:predicted Zn-dependent protease
MFAQSLSAKCNRDLGTSPGPGYHSIVKSINLLFAFALLAVPGAFGQGLPDLGDVSQSELTPLQERRLGLGIMREIRADRSYSDDVEITDYLNTLGYRLVSAGASSRQEFDFFLILDPQVNAFALPGGFVGVNSGLLLAAQSESELASVLAHEIAHVTQHHIARMLVAQKQAAITSLAGLALAILAARVNSQMSQAALMASQAGSVQSSLNFTRDNEREADRVGFQTLEQAGFDPQAMPLFFERLQHATRFYETGAPSYLRTHPLTYERIADMQNRAQDLPYRQVPDSLEFQLIRAKLKAMQGSPQDSVAFFEESLKERRYLSEAASRYGMVAALIRYKAYARAKQELETLRNTVRSSPIIDTLAAQLYLAAGDIPAALQTYRKALTNYPGYRALVYDYADALLRSRQPEEALKLVESRLQYTLSDYQLYQLQAQCYAALNKSLQQHRALAESYYRLGNIPAAIEQLVLAQKSGGSDFYQQSSVDARLRELRMIDSDTRKEGRDKK